MSNRLGYISCSGENIDELKAMLREQGVEDKNILIEAAGYSDKAYKPTLNKTMDFLGAGDTLVITSISHLAESLTELTSILEQLSNKETQLVSIMEDLNINKDNVRALRTVLKAYERNELIVKPVKRTGNYKGRAKIQPDSKLLEAVYKLWKLSGENNIKTKDAMRMLGLEPNTFYRRMKEYEENQIVDF